MVTRPILIRPPDTSVAGSWRCFQWKPWLQRYERWPTYGGIEVHVIDRPGKRFLGGGETGQGPASIANAIAAATGKWLRDCRANRLGNIRSLCPVPFEKIFWFSEDANHFISAIVLSFVRGALAIVTNVGTGCGGRGER